MLIVMPKKKFIKEIHKSGQICLPAATIGKLMNLSPERVSDMRLARITQEFARGFHFLKNYGKSATFFGSADAWQETSIIKRQKILPSCFPRMTLPLLRAGVLE